MNEIKHSDAVPSSPCPHAPKHGGRVQDHAMLEFCIPHKAPETQQGGNITDGKHLELWTMKTENYLKSRR